MLCGYYVVAWLVAKFWVTWVTTRVLLSVAMVFRVDAMAFVVNAMF